MQERSKLLDSISCPDIFKETTLNYLVRMALREAKGNLIGQLSRSYKYFETTQEHLNLFFRLGDPEYFSSSSLLDHSKITAANRQKLKSWLLNQTKNFYCRDTYATASRFIDMFFQKGQDIHKAQFQLLGLSCLILACKNVESRAPYISYQVFSKERIFQLEKSLLRIFNYKLNPVTYIQISEELFKFWDSYLDQQNRFSCIKYFTDHQSSIRRARTIFQLLDCLDLVPKTLSINLIDLVACAFYVEHRKFCILRLAKTVSKGERSFVQDSNNSEFEDLYSKIMLKFFKILKQNVRLFSSLNLALPHKLYILQFARLNPKIKVPAFRKFREEILRQTYDQEISQIAQAVLRRKRVISIS